MDVLESQINMCMIFVLKLCQKGPRFGNVPCQRTATGGGILRTKSPNFFFGDYSF